MEDEDDAKRAEALGANAAFYRAFAQGDYEAMESLWSERDSVVCVHPGWPPVSGRVDVMASWLGILADPPQPAVQASNEEVVLLGDTAMVVCFETIGDILLVATNLFVDEHGRWRLVHHHAGVTEHRPASAPPTPPPTGTVH